MNKIRGLWKPSSSALHSRLDGRVAIITGAASGIGFATAKLFVAHGAKVVVADIQAELGKKAAAELGSHAQFFYCDVRNEQNVAGAVEFAVSTWGKLDILFSNAGTAGPSTGIADINVEEFDDVMAVHVRGGMLGAKHTAKVMKLAGRGVIIFNASTSATLGGTGPAPYSAAKAALLSLMRSLAAELGSHGIRVNAVSPHCVATKMTIDMMKTVRNLDLTLEQLDSILTADSSIARTSLTVESVAQAVLFLASDDANYISGHNLEIDGGYSTTKTFKTFSKKASVHFKEPPLAELLKASSSTEKDGHGDDAQDKTREIKNSEKENKKEDKTRESKNSEKEFKKEKKEKEEKDVHRKSKKDERMAPKDGNELPPAQKP